VLVVVDDEIDELISESSLLATDVTVMKFLAVANLVAISSAYLNSTIQFCKISKFFLSFLVIFSGLFHFSSHNVPLQIAFIEKKRLSIKQKPEKKTVKL
jgi:hypothetical protein